MADVFTPDLRDDAADAANLITRIGYATLAIGVPAAAGLPGNAIIIAFAIGIVLVLAASWLNPAPIVFRRVAKWRRSTLFALVLALVVWAAVSLVWTPFPAAGLRRIATLAALAAPTILAFSVAPAHMRAADLYLFPIGVLGAILLTFAIAIARANGVATAEDAGANLSLAVVVLAFPAMAALAARRRNGLARALVILCLAYTSVVGGGANVAALLAGFSVFSFALSDAPRTGRDLGVLAALIVVLAPLAARLAPGLAHLVGSIDLSLSPAPGPALAASAKVIADDPFRFLTGHGLEAAVRAAKAGVLGPDTPRAPIFEIWYDLGVVGAALVGAILWRAFLAVDGAAPRMQPYLMATLASLIVLGATSSGWSQPVWLILLAVAVAAADGAARGQYSTSRPSAADLAHF